ncbi:MAG TPA: hypothetical protein VFN67_01655 [Polyangiales bacterium]|nr:hypothetical protein [Polyangiales bacterium]
MWHALGAGQVLGQFPSHISPGSIMLSPQVDCICAGAAMLLVPAVDLAAGPAERPAAPAPAPLTLEALPATGVAL